MDATTDPQDNNDNDNDNSQQQQQQQQQEVHSTRTEKTKRVDSGFTKSGTSLLADIATHLETPFGLEDTEAAAARFDVSPFRLWLLFQSVDDNQDGFISKKELMHALSSASTTDKNGDTVPSRHGDSTEDDEEGYQEVMPLADIRALDELFDRVVCSDIASSDGLTSESEVDESGDEKTHEHQNCIPASKSDLGIAFPQFCRIMRYLWLQLLLNPELDNPKDPNGDYSFDCIDYAAGYYRHKRVTGNASEKRTTDFFTAPRHGLARMRWIDVPSGTFVPGSTSRLKSDDEGNNKWQERNYQRESFRITILRLAVKYRFHPTSIEDAIDLHIQEPKVNSFEHSLLDLGKFNCGTMSWLRHAGDDIGGPDVDTPSNQQLGHWARDADTPRKETPRTSSLPSLPLPRPAARASSTQSFHSYHKEAEAQGRGSHIPQFVMAEGEDDITANEGRHYFITIPMFELSRRSQSSLDLYHEVTGLIPLMQIEPLLIEVNEAALGIFVASLPDANLVVTCSTKWRSTRVKPFYYEDHSKGNSTAATQRRAKRRTRRRKRDAGGDPSLPHEFGDEDDSSSDYASIDSEDDEIMAMVQDEKMSLERVKLTLKKRHSIQRHRNSNWLMHAIIDAVVDKLVPISKIYVAQLRRMSNRIFELQHRLSKRDVKMLIVMKRDLEWLQHELRPFARVIRHLIDDRNIGIEVTHYLEDVEDHLLSTLEELSSLANECTSLKDEYNAYLDRRTNDILYVLTLVTTLIVPGQFFTGYYGMNFVDPVTEEPAIPLLNMGGTGVLVFWALAVGLTGIVALTMYQCNFFQRELTS